MDLSISHKRVFSDEQHESFAGLGATLAKIHRRLVAEGYMIRNGMIIPPKKISDNIRFNRN